MSASKWRKYVRRPGAHPSHRPRAFENREVILARRGSNLVPPAYRFISETRSLPLRREIAGPEGAQAIAVARPFIREITEQILAFALGRVIESADPCARRSCRRIFEETALRVGFQAADRMRHGGLWLGATLKWRCVSVPYDPCRSVFRYREGLLLFRL
jgi:hypothetical protein